MSSFVEQFIEQTGMIEVGPSISTFYNQTSDLILSILNAKTDNFYYVFNLQTNPIYFDAYFSTVLANPSHFSYEQHLINLQYKYWESIDFDKNLPLSFSFKSAYQFLYLIPNIELFLDFKIKTPVNIDTPFYRDSFNLLWFLNYEVFNNFNYLHNLRLFSNSLYWSTQYTLESRNLNIPGFYIYFLYNRWDFEMVVHSVFSLWYETHAAGFEDDLFLSQSGLLNSFTMGVNTEIQYFSAQWAFSYELTEGYYMNRYGKPNEAIPQTEYSTFQAQHSYAIHDYLSKKNSILEYLENVIEYQPLKKKEKQVDVADFTQYMEELNRRKQNY